MYLAPRETYPLPPYYRTGSQREWPIPLYSRPSSWSRQFRGLRPQVQFIQIRMMMPKCNLASLMTNVKVHLQDILSSQTSIFDLQCLRPSRGRNKLGFSSNQILSKPETCPMYQLSIRLICGFRLSHPVSENATYGIDCSVPGKYLVLCYGIWPTIDRNQPCSASDAGADFRCDQRTATWVRSECGQFWWLFRLLI